MSKQLFASIMFLLALFSATSGHASIPDQLPVRPVVSAPFMQGTPIVPPGTPELTCMDYNVMTDSITVTWIPPADTGAWFDHYEVSYGGSTYWIYDYAQTSLSKPFFNGVFSTVNAVGVAAVTDLGTGSTPSFEVPLISRQVINGDLHLSWDTMFSCVSNPWHYIYEETSPGAWMLVDSTQGYSWSTPGLQCGVRYYMALEALPSCNLAGRPVNQDLPFINVALPGSMTACVDSVPLGPDLTGTYTVEMYDSFGDGWNGNMVLLEFDNHTDTVSIIDSVWTDTVHFDAHQGDSLTIHYITGGFVNEVFFRIAAPDGSWLFESPWPNVITSSATLWSGTLNATDWALPAITYSWSPAAGLSDPTIASPMAAPTSATTYSLTVADPPGCSVMDQVHVSTVAGAVAGFTTATVGPTVSITDQSTGAIAWATDMGDGTSYTQANFTHTYATEGQYTVCQVAQGDCNSDTTCQEIWVFLTDSVWPGDANYDGVVDNTDVLPIGLGNAIAGPVRQTTSILWQAHAALDWPQTFGAWDNYKHADCDGNGLIDNDDTLAVTQNYSLTHNKTFDMPAPNATNPLLWVEMEQDTMQPGGLMIAHIHLGDSLINADSVYGVAFTVLFDPGLLDSASMYFKSHDGWIGTEGLNMIEWRKMFYTEGKLEAAITRTNQIAVDGFGKIAELGGATADNLSGKDMGLSVWLPVAIANVTLINEQGMLINTSVKADSVLLFEDDVSVQQPQTPAAVLHLYPNPTSGRLSVLLTGTTGPDQLRVYDTTGRLVHMESGSGVRQQLELNKLPRGVYLLEVLVGETRLVERFAIH